MDQITAPRPPGPYLTGQGDTNSTRPQVPPVDEDLVGDHLSAEGRGDVGSSDEITPDAITTSDVYPSDEITRERLRTAIPVAVAVVLLFGTLMAGALVLRDMVDLGVWLLGSY